MKILLLLVGVFVVYMGTAQAIHHSVVFPSFVSLERDEAAKDQARCAEAIQRELELISYALADWASWDDTYQFIVDENEDYKQANLLSTMFTNNRLNYVGFYDLNGRAVWKGAFDLVANEPITFEAFSRPSLELTSPLFNLKEMTSDLKGIMLTEHGPMMVASRRILTTEVKGPMRGTMIRGKLLDEGQVKGIAERTRVDLNLLRIPGQTLSAEATLALAELSSGAALSVREIEGGEALRVYSVLNDIEGAPALLMATRIPREISARGRAAVRFAGLSDLAVGLAIILLMWVTLQRTVVGPLTTLTRHAIAVGKSDDLSLPIAMGRSDEFGTLANEFDGMTRSLAESRSRLMETAHSAGMAEIATGVIHNVGNVLNSVNVSARRAVERVDALGVSELGEVVELMQKHAGNLGRYLESDAKGRLIPSFLAQLKEDMAGEKDEVLSELQSLTTNVQHIAEIINTQQANTNVSGAASQVPIVVMIEDALRINAAAMERHAVRVEREFEETPPIVTERHKVLQILVNLLSNAKYALDECPTSDRCITIRVRAPKDGESSVCIQICDNGVGISKEHFAKLFTHGFTTRTGGHGFGLHNCANAAKSIGGRLSAASEGPGKGATFTLELPLRVAEAVA